MTVSEARIPSCPTPLLQGRCSTRLYLPESPPLAAVTVPKTHAPFYPPAAGTVWCNGASCGNPGAFTNSAIAALTFPSYVEAVRTNIVASGDNCSRALFIGALFAAQVRCIGQELMTASVGGAARCWQAGGATANCCHGRGRKASQLKSCKGGGPSQS